MAIPSQNEILLPFIRRLEAGDTVTRGSILKHISDVFRITPEEAQMMSGPHNTVLNRLVWCDVYFGKAGFISKKKHSTTPLGDEFRITAKGQRELRYNAARISVAYLQSFYNGRVYRGAGSDDSTSEAELELLQALESLSTEYTVFHSVPWIGKQLGTIGEADFIIAHPRYGILLLEVKGGVVTTERQGNDVIWKTRSRNNKISTIQDPCKQASRNRWALQAWLQEDDRTKRFRYAIFPAVALPDSQVTSDLRPDCTKDIFIDISHLSAVEDRIKAIFEYWQKHADARNSVMDGKPAVDALIELIIPSRKLQPKIAEVFARERRKIDELTLTQYRVLRQLRQHKRASIVGGAGTGKTMLAIEKAAQIAETNAKVLFLCFNRNLARWIDTHIKYNNVTVRTFHKFAGDLMTAAGLAQVENSQHFYENPAEYLDRAIEALRKGGNLSQYQFDAVIIDEAQDFEDVWWVPIPDVLKSESDSVLYVFFDDNQRLYRQLSNVPIEGNPFYLDENCRNTQAIHSALKNYMTTTDDIICNGPEGRKIEELVVVPGDASINHLSRKLHQLTQEGVALEDIILLTPVSEKRSIWQTGMKIGAFTITWDLESQAKNTLRACTIYQFKGLESAVVILTELDSLPNDERRNPLLYVAVSRARNHVISLGQMPS